MIRFSLFAVAIGTAPLPKLIFSMATALRSACVLSEKQSKFQKDRYSPNLSISQLQIRDLISVPFHCISVDTEVSVFHGQLPIKGQLQRFHKLSLFDRFRYVENGLDINF